MTQTDSRETASGLTDISGPCPDLHLWCCSCAMEVCTRGQADYHRAHGHILDEIPLPNPYLDEIEQRELEAPYDETTYTNL